YDLADQERGVGWNPRASPESQWKRGRTRALRDLAGAPDRRLRIALVAGTQGKGSTCAILASIPAAADVRCGLYTKPHLQTYRDAAILGRTLGSIATEKGGILRRSRAGLLAAQRPSALRALLRACRQTGARCQVVPPLQHDVPLAGAHQRQNAALAIEAARQ